MDQPGDDPSLNAQGADESGPSARGSIEGKLDRLFVIAPGNGSSYLNRLYGEHGLEPPTALGDFEDRILDWCDAYKKGLRGTRILELYLANSVYLFDQGEAYERVVLAYGISSSPKGARDQARMRRFPDVNVGIQRHLSDAVFPADRGHFLSHASGGELDLNLFPQRRDLNRGWSADGKNFRQMEKYVADHLGTFHYHRPVYDDATWIPASLDYGVPVDDSDWWVAVFANKGK